MWKQTVITAIFAASATAQTFTECNPLEKTCPAEAALGNKRIDWDFSKGDCKDFTNLPGTEITFEKNGALFSIEKEGQAPTIASNRFIFFGRLEVELMATHGQGVVTSVVLQSADLDEIDWEWVGGDNEQVQTNYFGKGDTTTYDRGAYHPVSSPLTTFHTYTIEWTSKKVDWIIDGNVVRTLKYEDAKGGSRFPQTPMEVKLGTWVAGGPDAPEGTIIWAGGRTDFSQAPFNAWYKSVSVVDYAGGDSPSEYSVKDYIYGDKTGSWESIEVVKGASPPIDDKNNAEIDDKESDKDADKGTDKESDKPEEAATGSTVAAPEATADTTSTLVKSPSGATPVATPSSTPSDAPSAAAAAASLPFAGAVMAGIALFAQAM